MNDEIDGAPPSLGLGDVLDLARLLPRETVLDLGSGPGRDLLAAARSVGPAGRAIGERHGFVPVSRARGRAECPALQLRAQVRDGAWTLRLSFEEADLPVTGRSSRKSLPTFQDDSCR